MKPRYTPQLWHGHIIAVKLAWNPRSRLWRNRLHFPFGEFNQRETFASREGAMMEGLAIQHQNETATA